MAANQAAGSNSGSSSHLDAGLGGHVLGAGETAPPLQQRVDVGVEEEAGHPAPRPVHTGMVALAQGPQQVWSRRFMDVDRRRCRYPNRVPGRASWAAEGGVTPQCS